MQHSFTSYPERAYDYVYGHYGTIGLIVLGVAFVVAIVSIMIWFDRSK